jgi:hypothetical protein
VILWQRNDVIAIAQRLILVLVKPRSQLQPQGLILPAALQQSKPAACQLLGVVSSCSLWEITRTQHQHAAAPDESGMWLPVAGASMHVRGAMQGLDSTGHSRESSWNIAALSSPAPPCKISMMGPVVESKQKHQGEGRHGITAGSAAACSHPKHMGQAEGSCERTVPTVCHVNGTSQLKHVMCRCSDGC